MSKTPNQIPSYTVNHSSRLTELPILFDELGFSDLSDDQRQLISIIDACLPQTQCGLCDHPEGCLPYAHAIVTHRELHNKCVPGGQPVTDQIAQILTNQSILSPIIVEPLTARSSKWHIDQETHRPQEMRAVIREDDCIGCTKCIPACPVDAIIGTGKHMHSIFSDLCTGCELCLPPCPVDCIDLVPINRAMSDSEREEEQRHLRNRYHTHLNRVAEQIQDSRNSRPVISVVESKLNNVTHQTIDIDEAQAKQTIAIAKLRSKIKKLEKQLSSRENAKKRDELKKLQLQLTNLQN